MQARARIARGAIGSKTKSLFFFALLALRPAPRREYRDRGKPRRGKGLPQTAPGRRKPQRKHRERGREARGGTPAGQRERRMSERALGERVCEATRARRAPPREPPPILGFSGAGKIYNLTNFPRLCIIKLDG